MITLLKFAPAFGLADPSMFCMKADLLLKLAGVPYQVEICSNPARGPKGKLPAIRDDGLLIGDSELIRQHVERKHKLDLDAGLSPASRAIAHAFCRMLEERTYWAIVYNRWIENLPAMSAAFFASLPPVVRSVVPLVAQRQVRGYLRGQGLGRHSRDEIYAFAVADIRAVATQLGDNAWFMGAAPSAADATVYAAIAGLLDPPFESPARDEIRRHPNLVAYADRMAARFYPPAG